jgi:FkbM family methyltransferase
VSNRDVEASVDPFGKRLLRAAIPPPLYRALRRRTVARLIGSYEANEVSHVYAGFPLRVHLADPLAAAWYDHDWPEQAELTFLQRGKLQPGARVFDLGAHQCVVALMLTQIVGPAGEVVAVEAEPHNVRISERNRALNGANNLTVVHAAASNTPGTIPFTPSLNGRVADGRLGAVTVPAVTADGLAGCYGDPDVVIVDVEGFECNVLEGAERVGRFVRPDFLVEVHAGCGLEKMGGSVNRLLRWFDERAYEVFAGEGDQPDASFRPVSAGVPAGRFLLIARPSA